MGSESTAMLFLVLVAAVLFVAMVTIRAVVAKSRFVFVAATLLIVLSAIVSMLAGAQGEYCAYGVMMPQQGTQKGIELIRIG